MLTNTTPLAANAVKADITEIAAGNGYSAGGSTATNTEAASAGTATMTGTMVTFTASAGSIGPFRYAVLYNSTAAGGPLASWWDYGSALTLAAGESLQVQFNGSATTGTILTLT